MKKAKNVTVVVSCVVTFVLTWLVVAGGVSMLGYVWKDVPEVNLVVTIGAPAVGLFVALLAARQSYRAAMKGKAWRLYEEQDGEGDK
ncbi:hypothetical protein STSP2_01282 [Anaerohalosphaera lusitana]|uniref:Uncharacterized protein n=1 Tax=Anaerohalosphaera lusitana TaxID=1936003 RepID=A0A1U9NJZ1_9BACT|nr:hypothetical protein [Anaerohalosphaera lusitana]AQT68127.1 hypothetical protein STSP2_01282 [Anaerohalosphaera lusitana]